MGSSRRHRIWIQTVTRPLLAVGCRILQILPLKVSEKLAKLIGWGIMQHGPSRRLMLANLEVAFPDWPKEKRRKVATRAIQSIALSFLETIWFLPRGEQISPRVSMDEESKRVYKNLFNGKGVILISPHLGNWELGQVYLNANHCTAHAVGARIRNVFAHNLLIRSRSQFGGGVIAEKGAARGILQVLKSGQHVTLLVDQNTRIREGGAFVDFFGLPATMSRAPAAFVRRAGVNIVISAFLHRPGQRFQTVFRELKLDSLEKMDDESILRAINQLSESLIRQYPDQYLWLYRRWRYIPANLPEKTYARYPFYAVATSSEKAISK